MRLSDGFVTQNYRDELLMVAVGPEGKLFRGLGRANGTAAFIIEQLKKETSIEELADVLTTEYDVDRETARRDAERIIWKLRSIGALKE